MKIAVSISFLLALLWQPFYQLGYISYWEMNKEKIASTECINRFKPMMHCNGKCQLYKQLKKAADEEAENNKLPVAALKLKTIDAFIEIPAAWEPFVAVEMQDKSTNRDYSSKPLSGYFQALLKPPQKLA